MANLWIGQIQAISNNINRLLGKVAVLNASDVRINPSTEDTLALIKSTDGIKKITDAVQVTTVKPDGTNTQPSMDALIRPGFQKLVAPDSAELSVRYGDSLAKLSGFANMLYNATAARWDLPAGMPSDQLTWDASGMYGSPALFVTTRMFGWDSVASLNRVAAVQPANGAKTTATNVIVVQPIALDGTAPSSTPVVRNYESEKSLLVSPGKVESFTVNFTVSNVVLTTGFMLIDLSDTTIWHHIQTGHIDLLSYIVHINPSTAFLGKIEIGFLSNVSATSGTFNVLDVAHGEQSSQPYVYGFNPQPYHIDCRPALFTGPSRAADTTWQTDINLFGPDEATTHPSGNGDLVMKITRTAGNVDIGITLLYNTSA